MKRAIPWGIAFVALVAFGASFSELQRMRGRFGDVTRHQNRHHLYYREFVIRSEMEGVDGPILVIGDSITERAKLPETIDGKRVINAGIGGTSVEDFGRIVPILIERQPSLIAVALGTNDTAESLRTNYEALLIQIKKLSPRLLAVGVTPQDGAELKNAQIKAAAGRQGVRFIEMPLPEGSTLSDRIHLNANGYQKWTPALVAAISGQSS
jgi:lysophospholipase L1-like esterase